MIRTIAESTMSFNLAAIRSGAQQQRGSDRRRKKEVMTRGWLGDAWGGTFVRRRRQLLDKLFEVDHFYGTERRLLRPLSTQAAYGCPLVAFTGSRDAGPTHRLGQLQ
jgi:hypothetical protein